MSIISEQISGTIINVTVKSSNIKNANYDTTTKILKITFNNSLEYEFKDVPWDVFTKFRMSESQGKFFNKNINGKYEYKKLSN